MLDKAPVEVSQWLAGANLFALKKRQHSQVAAGDVTHRLVSKLCCLHCKELASELLQPLQYGVGIKGGAEAVVHCTRAILSKIEGKDGMCIVTKLVASPKLVPEGPLGFIERLIVATLPDDPLACQQTWA